MGFSFLHIKGKYNYNELLILPPITNQFHLDIALFIYLNPELLKPKLCPNYLDFSGHNADSD